MQRMPRTNKKPAEFEFDIALSFAGPHRGYVQRLVRELRRRGIRFFYDKDHASRLWGKGTEEYEYIYGPASRYFVPIISSEYERRDWTMFEFETAKREARKREGDFILPIRADDTRVLGLHDECNYLHLDQYSVSEIAEILEQKLRSEGHMPTPRTRGKNQPEATVLPLSFDARSALGLLVTAACPLRIRYLQLLFPQVKWDAHLRLFRKGGLISDDSSVITVSRTAAKAFKDEKEQDELNKRWISALRPCSHYSDIALFLSLHLLRAKLYDEAADILSAIAESVDPGPWLPTFQVGLDAFADDRLFRKLSAPVRLRVLNAAGICHANGEEPLSALPYYDRLQRLARKYDDRHWLGQAFLNKGVAYHRASDRDGAHRWYSKALELARDLDDPLFISKCLVNLAQLDVDNDPTGTIEKLDEVISLKESIDDDAGIASALEIQAVALSRLDDVDSAMKCFKKCNAIAKKLDLRYLRCLSLSNQGQTLLDCGKRSEAVRCLRQARRMADAEGFSELMRRCLELEATAHFGLGHFAEAKDCFEFLVASAEEGGDHYRQICAQHGLGVIFRMENNTSESGRYFTAALRLSRKHGASDWTVRCIVDRTREVESDGGLGPPDPRKLQQSAKAEEKRGLFHLAGSLWREIARGLIVSEADVTEIQVAYENADRLLRQSKDSLDDWIELTEERYSFLWNRGHFDPAISVLRDGDGFLRNRDRGETRCSWMNQQATCLTDLDRYGEAEKLLRVTTRLAERHGYKELQQMALHNLGESQLRSGKPDKALVSLEESQNLARSLNDRDSEMTSAHSYALALGYLGNKAAASKALVQCRDRAKRCGAWNEYVRAWVALGNLAWETRRMKLAEDRYQQAMKHARQHHCKDMIPMIAGNYSSLLRQKGHVRRAMKMLESVIDDVRHEPDATIYYRELAETYEAAGETEQAVTTWRSGMEHASSIGDFGSYATCSSQLAELLLSNDNLAAAEHELRHLLSQSDLDEEDRVIALGQLLRVLIRDGDNRDAQAEYEEFTQLSLRPKFYDHCIEVHLDLFEWLWNNRPSDRLQALQMCVAAQSALLRFGDDEQFGEVHGHALQVLAMGCPVGGRDELITLRLDFQRWIQKQLDDEFAVKFLISPLAIVEELYDDLGNPEQLSKRLTKLARTHSVDDVELLDLSTD